MRLASASTSAASASTSWSSTLMRSVGPCRRPSPREQVVEIADDVVARRRQAVAGLGSSARTSSASDVGTRIRRPRTSIGRPVEAALDDPLVLRPLELVGKRAVEPAQDFGSWAASEALERATSRSKPSTSRPRTVPSSATRVGRRTRLRQRHDDAPGRHDRRPPGQHGHDVCARQKPRGPGLPRPRGGAPPTRTRRTGAVWRFFSDSCQTAGSCRPGRGRRRRHGPSRPRQAHDRRGDLLAAARRRASRADDHGLARASRARVASRSQAPGRAGRRGRRTDAAQVERRVEMRRPARPGTQTRARPPRRLSQSTSCRYVVPVFGGPTCR